GPHGRARNSTPPTPATAASADKASVPSQIGVASRTTTQSCPTASSTASATGAAHHGQLTMAPGSLRRRAGAPSGTSTHPTAEIDESRDTYGGQQKAKDAMANSPCGRDRYPGRDQREDADEL